MAIYQSDQFRARRDGGNFIAQAATVGGVTYYEWRTSAGVLRGHVGYGGAGDSTLAVVNLEAGPIDVYTSGLARWRYGADGHFTPRVPDLLDVGDPSNRVRHVHAAGVVAAAGGMRSLRGTVSLAPGVTGTGITLPGDGVYDVAACIADSNDAANYLALMTVAVLGTNAVIKSVTNGTLLTVAMTGLAVRVTQNSGGTQTITTSALRRPVA